MEEKNEIQENNIPAEVTNTKPKVHGFNSRRPKPNTTMSFRKPRYDHESDTDIMFTLLNRVVYKTRAGGRVKSMSVLVVMGDGKNKIGIGTGKAIDTQDALAKAKRNAKKNMIEVAMHNNTICHDIEHKKHGVKIILRRAKPGAGLKCGGITRQMFQTTGIKDIGCKIVANASAKHNVAYALIETLKKIQDPKQIAQQLGKTTKEILMRKA